MEEIHLRRRILEHNSELLLTWWDERKGHQEGILISCQCKNGCPGTTTAASTGDTSVVVREKMSVRTSPTVSKLMDYGSGFALYSDNTATETVSKGDSEDGQNRYITLPNEDFTVIVPDTSKKSKPSPRASPGKAEWRLKRPYPCSYCSKPFRTSYEKRRHEMIHTGKRPWNCTECSKSFVDRANLRNHMSKRHEGYKPYKCSYCDIHFFTSDSRSIHEKIHVDRLHQLKVEAIEAKLKNFEDGEDQLAQAGKAEKMVVVQEESSRRKGKHIRGNRDAQDAAAEDDEEILRAAEEAEADDGEDKEDENTGFVEEVVGMEEGEGDDDEPPNQVSIGVIVEASEVEVSHQE